jgi:hypothetical protein
MNLAHVLVFKCFDVRREAYTLFVEESEMPGDVVNT